MKLTLLMVLLAALPIAAACSSGGEEEGEAERLQVLTSLPLFADMVSEVGGDRVEVSALLPSGADPHTWEPAPQDVVKVEEADIVFVNGLDLEPSAMNVIEAHVGEGVEIVELAEESGAQIMRTGDDDHDHAHDGDADHDHNGDADHEHDEEDHVHTDDPHLWMDPGNGLAYVVVIRDHLVEIDPDGEEEYQANFAPYRREIDDARDYLEAAAEQVPEENRMLITTHDAFGYLAEHIGYEIIAFVAAGPGSEASPEDIAEIVTAVDEQGVPVVFSEPQLDAESGTLKQVAADTGAEICTLYSDSLDDRVPTFIELMRFNADELVRCLG